MFLKYFKYVDKKKLAADTFWWYMSIRIAFVFFDVVCGGMPLKEALSDFPVGFLIGYLVFFVMDGIYLTYKEYKKRQIPIIRALPPDEE